MKCKHENADHLMPGDRFQPYGKYPRQRVGTLTEVQCEQFRCLDCGAWLSLGPSDEEPVRVEVRAAELAVQPAGTYVSADAQSGWVCAVNDYDPPPWPHCPDAWAGWLAREIEQHDHTHGGEHGD